MLGKTKRGRRGSRKEGEEVEGRMRNGAGNGA